MRKTLIAVAIGIAAFAVAACTPGTDVQSLPADSLAPLESMVPLESDSLESTEPMASPSDMLESPASS